MVRFDPPRDRRKNEIRANNFIVVEDEEAEEEMERQTSERIANLRRVSMRDPEEIKNAELTKDDRRNK